MWTGWLSLILLSFYSDTHLIALSCRYDGGLGGDTDPEFYWEEMGSWGAMARDFLAGCVVVGFARSGGAAVNDDTRSVLCNKNRYRDWSVSMLLHLGS
jgi:hypothetical protein